MSSSTSSSASTPLQGKDLLKRLSKVNLKKQSVVFDESNAIRRNGAYPDHLVDYLHDDQKTLYELFQSSVTKYPFNPCLGTRQTLTARTAKKGQTAGEAGPYVFKTYKEIGQLVTHFGSGLRKLGLKPKDRLAIYSKNREEWVIAEQACNAHSLVTVAIYDTFGEENIKYVLNHAEITHVLCANPASTKKILQIARGPNGVPGLRYIIQMDFVLDAQKTELEELLTVKEKKEDTQKAEEKQEESSQVEVKKEAIKIETERKEEEVKEEKKEEDKEEERTDKKDGPPEAEQKEKQDEKPEIKIESDNKEEGKEEVISNPASEKVEEKTEVKAEEKKEEEKKDKGKEPATEEVSSSSSSSSFSSASPSVKIEVIDFAAVLAQGKESNEPPVPPAPEDLAVIMYTSGTTGDPKGVMLTHRSMVATIAGVVSILGGIMRNDVYISYLPLAHIFERETVAGVLGEGASIGFFQGDVTKLVDDIKTLRPTVMCGVPRVYDRIMAGIRKTVDETKGFKKWAFNKGYSSRKTELSKGKDSFVWSRVVFSKIKQKLGGRLRIAVTGGAPISHQTHEFVKVCFGCPILQGYGLTETCAGATISHPDDPTVGHVGPPIPSVEIKLGDVADMDYFSKNNQGEICIRGPSVSSGYYKDPQKTAEDFDSEGWFHTGDVGEWQADGTLKIIDRKKNMFKLAQGEYVAAEKLELVFQQSRLISQVWVYGDSFKSVLVGFVFPNLDYCKVFAQEKSLTFDLESFKEDTALRKAILDDLTAIGKANKLQGFELLKSIRVVGEMTLADDLITPTFKLRRPQLKKYFQKEIDSMYTQLEATAPQ